LGWCFHTLKEDRPYALIKIPYAALIKSIVIYNRFDACQERAATLNVLAGLDQDNLTELFYEDNEWYKSDQPLSIDVPEGFGPIRIIRLQLNAFEFFHLGEVKIFEKSFLD
jgi:hypothetical protein